MNHSLPIPRSGRTAALLLAASLLVAGAAQAKSKNAPHGYLGVTLQDINTSMAKALQLEEGVGVLVLEVIEDGPAETAGLEQGDVILEFDGQAITEDHDLSGAVRRSEPGTTVAVGIMRNGERRSLDVELGEAQSSHMAYVWTSRDGKAPHVQFFGDADDHNVWVGGDELHVAPFGFHADRGYLGIELGDLDGQLGEYFGVEDGEGALINAVRDDSPAAAAGLRAGDVITRIGDEEITDAGDVFDVLADTEPEDEVTIGFIRKGAAQTATATLAELPEDTFGFRMGRMHAPHVGGRFGHDLDFAFPEGFDQDIHFIVPDGSRARRRVIRIDEDGEQIRELRDELETMKEELKALKKDLGKTPGG